MASVNLENVQGDLYSRGFPKFFETYYFFSIAEGKEKDFSNALNALGKSGQIANLKKVLDDWEKIGHTESEEFIPVSNALIAFSRLGLEKVGHLETQMDFNVDRSRSKLFCLILPFWP